MTDETGLSTELLDRLACMRKVQQYQTTDYAEDE